MMRRGFLLSAAAAFVLIVTGCESDPQGKILSSLFFESAADGEIDHSEPNDTRERAIRIVPNDRPFTTAFHILSDVDYFVFPAVEGVSYVAYTINLDMNVRTHISVVNERDRIVYTSGTSGAELGSVRVRWTAESSGSYLIKVYSVGTRIGAYTLALETE